jgi:CheY-like chemotaxis protein
VSNILLVDDEEMNREVLREMLMVHGHKVREATNGAEAFAFACEELPDLILMDIRMPQLDGFSSLAKLRAHPQTANIPVVAVTAFAMDPERHRAEVAGFNGYVSKPVDFQLLLRTIQHLLSKQSG